MKEPPKKRLKKEEKQLNSIDETENFDQYKNKNTLSIPYYEALKVGGLKNLLKYLTSNPDIKNLYVKVVNDLNEAVNLLATNNTLTSLCLLGKNGTLDEGFTSLAANKTLTSLSFRTRICSPTGITSLLQNKVLTKLILGQITVSVSSEKSDEIACILSKHPL